MNRCATRWLGFVLPAALGLVGFGCDRPPAQAPERTPPNPSAPAAYGPPPASAAPAMVRALPAPAGAGRWTNAELAVLQTELSPAVLVRASARHLDLFAGTTNSAVGAPSFITWTTMNGPRTFPRGEELDLEKTKLEECWLLVWWAGAAGWTNWDAPWVVYLQHRPRRLRLDDDGLHLDFAQAAGEVVLLPLYGYEKLPQRGRDLLAEHGMAGRKVRTWDWPEVLRRDPLTRIRYWAAVTRELPIRCEESFKVDRGADTVTFRYQFAWHRIKDDWNTPHLRLAPISPTLALAVKNGFPARFSRAWFDLDYFTAYGPYLAIEGVDQFEVALPVLQYVHETESVAGGTNRTGVVQDAATRLEGVMGAQFSGARPFQPVEGGSYSPQALAEVASYARALPYCEPAIRRRASIALGQYFRERLLQTNQFAVVATDPGSGRVVRMPRDFAVNAGTGPGRTANALLLQALWAYAHFSDDWELPRERWPLVKTLWAAGAQTGWAGFGDPGIAPNGEVAGACIAFARLAYRAGDLDCYHAACAQLARELAVLCVKQRGADYFRKHQPYHSMEFMDAEVFLSGTGDAGGWLLDGPRFPAGVSAGGRRYLHRWDRFLDVDLARFYREYLGEEVRRELEWFQHRADPKQLDWDGREEPSFLSLRSLLLNEGPAALAGVAGLSQSGQRPARIVADCLALRRAESPPRYQRLIPPGGGKAWMPEPGPMNEGGNVGLVGSVERGQAAGGTPGEPIAWPNLAWKAWTAEGRRGWPFGEIRLGRAAPAAHLRPVSLNRNSRMLLYEPEPLGGR